ncbi:hypothetical protein [Candidatus Poriferisodalis sp.]|uniref:hypothetical protein n=1 Tax=Candidatus Poriferisodalis sp. TaxID=3101277 RepID=UPI003B02A2C4
MGFTKDLWTAMLSDEGFELAAALDRITTDEIASAIAAADLIVEPESPCDTSTVTSSADEA